MTVSSPPTETNGVVIDGEYEGWEVRVSRQDDEHYLISVWKGSSDLYPVVNEVALRNWFRLNRTYWPEAEVPPIGITGTIESGTERGSRIMIQSAPTGTAFLIMRWRTGWMTEDVVKDQVELSRWCALVDIDWEV